MRGRKKRKTLIERFWSKTKSVGGCILWTGATTEGYGTFAPKGTRTERAHRWLYQQVSGPLPPKIDVMHSCDTRLCVALQHLSPGTRKMNMVDAANKGRMPRGELSTASKLTARQVKTIRRRNAAGESLGKLAKFYRVGVPCIHKIVQRKNWKHL